MSKKRFIITAVLLIFIISAAALAYKFLLSNQETDDLAADKFTEQPSVKVPDFTVSDMGDKEVNFSSYIGKPTIINFWATWCGPCKTELPYFQKLYEKYGEEINFMMINLPDGQRETVDSVKSFINLSGYTLPFYFDTSRNTSYIFDMTYIPLTVFIDSDGKYLGNHVGAMTEEMLLKYINALSGE